MAQLDIFGQMARNRTKRRAARKVTGPDVPRPDLVWTCLICGLPVTEGPNARAQRTDGRGRPAQFHEPCGEVHRAQARLYKALGRVAWPSAKARVQYRGQLMSDLNVTLRGGKK